VHLKCRESCNYATLCTAHLVYMFFTYLWLSVFSIKKQYKVGDTQKGMFKLLFTLWSISRQIICGIVVRVRPIPAVSIRYRYRKNTSIPAPILHTPHVCVMKTIVLCFDCVPRCCSLSVKTLSTWNSSLHY